MNPTQLRRLPWSDNGKPAYVPPGDGPVNQMADIMESQACDVAQDLAEQAARLVRDRGAGVEEMRPLLILLAASTKDVVQVARLRAERLES
ncbi:hypothetical protein [Streptomyces tendae]|uniref:hypothetical protein n=1 Tax=Streptomyces tendae TaxID=1932 RepID=UPI0036B9FD42